MRVKVIFIISVLLFSTSLLAQNDTFNVRVTVIDSIRIIHNPFKSLCMFNHIVKIPVQIEAVEGLKKASLYYRKKGVDKYTMLSFTPACGGKNSYQGIAAIPDKDVTTSGIEYYIKAVDNVDKTNFWHSPDNPYFLPVSGYLESLITTAGGSMIFTDGNPDDGKMELEIPKKALGDKTVVSIRQLQVTKSYPSLKESLCAVPIRQYQIEPCFLNLQKPGTLTLLYSDINNDGKEDSTGLKENKLAIFWWDGYEWRYIGGSVDKKLNTVRAKITHFSLYALFPVGKITPEALRPRERIITPNGDGINDYAHFGGTPGDYTIKILDIAGREIRTIKDILVWDGKDNNGNYVESGAYIYQFKVILDEEPKIISGVIVIAK